MSESGGSEAPSPTEILTSGYEAFNRRDSQRLRELMVDDFLWNEAEEVPGRKVCHSADEFLAYMEGFSLMWEEFRFEPLELNAGDGGAILARVRGVGRGKASSEPFELEIHHVWRFRAGRVARMDAFLDPHAARAAAGIGRG